MALDNNYTGLTKLKDWWGKVKANFTYLDERISTIITTPAEGVSAQEIIDARQGAGSLGANIAEVKSHLADVATQINSLDAEVLLKANRTDLNAINTTKADIAYVDTKVAAVASGAPKAVATVAEMTDTTKNYVYIGVEVGYTAGNWYYWNGSAWTSGGVYQSTGVGDGEITPIKLNESIHSAIIDSPIKPTYGINLFDKNKALSDVILSTINKGELLVTIGFSTSDFISVEPNTTISLAAPRRIAEYDIYKNYIADTLIDNSTPVDTTIITNAKTRYIRFSILTTSINSGCVKLGAATTRRYPYSGKTILKKTDDSELYVDNVVNNRYEVKAGGKNLFDKSKVAIGVRLAVNSIVSTAIGWNTSDYVEVPQGQITINKVRYIHEYDKYFEPIVDSYVDLTTVQSYTFTVNENTKYIRFSYYDTATPIQAEAGNVATAYEDYYNSLYADNVKIQDLKEDLSEIDYTNVNLKKLNIISLFDDAWETSLGVVGEDIINSTYSSKSIKLTAIDTTACEIRKQIDLDIEGKIFFSKVYVEDVSKVEKLQFSFFNFDKSKYFYYQPTLKNGWNLLSVPCEAFGYTNVYLQEKRAIKYIYIRLEAQNTATATVTLDMIGLTNNAVKRGKVVLQFDDAWDGVWKYAKPAMDKYGFRGLVYVIKDLVNVNQFMTLEQLKTLYNNGWDLGTHGQVELTTLSTAEAIRTELLKNYNYLMDNGFTRSAKHYCTPAGKYNDMSLLEIKKLFLTHRTTEFRYNTLPIADRYLLGNISGNESNLDFLKSIIDNTERYKSLTILNWHQIVETGATGNVATASVFREFIDYLATKNIDVVTLSDVFNPMD